MFTFVIYLGEIPKFCQQCINSIEKFYPDLNIINTWGDCPIVQINDPRFASNDLRRWILSKHNEALYFDVDVELFQRLEFDKIDKPWFGTNESGVDEWLIYHKGQQPFFRDWVYNKTTRILTPSNHYEISGKDKFIHYNYSKGVLI